jgi:adenine-specific DNA methylase
MKQSAFLVVSITLRQNKFWGRKPHNVVAEYIEHYSSCGDIVCDTFVGSGVTAIEALRLGRKAIAVDLNPLCILIAKLTALPVDLKQLNDAFKTIESKLKSQIMDLYSTKCPSCGNTAKVSQLVWSIKEECNSCGKEIVMALAKKKGVNLFECYHCGKPITVEDTTSKVPFLVSYECQTCKKREKKTPDAHDLRKIDETDSMAISYWYPTDRLYYPNNMPFLKKEKSGLERTTKFG